MKKIILLVGLISTLLACHREFNYDVPLNPIDSYYYDNFCYPKTISDFINYLRFYQEEFPDIPFFRDYDKNKKHLSIVSNDSVFMILYKKDTLDYRPKNSPCNFIDMPDEQWNMKHFFRVSMQTDDSYGYSIATDDMMNRFNQGLYDLVSKKIPEFRENRKNRINFKIVLLEYNNGTLHKICESDSFDLINYPLYGDLSAYVKTFASEEGVGKIIFYYMYD